MDAAIFPVWIGCNLLLGLSAWRLARIWFPSDLPLPMLMHTLILSWAAIIVVAFTLGSTGILTWWSMLFGVTLLALAALAGSRRFHQPTPCTPAPVSSADTKWLWFWGAVASLWIAHSVTGGLMKFPTDWDTLHYHLPIIVHWLQAESLYAPDSCLWSSPGNNEVLGLWMVAPFSGDFLIALNNWPATLLFACAAVDAGKRLGLSNALAHATAFAVVSNYVVLNQLLDASNDIAVVAPFLACIAYGIRFAQSSHHAPRDDEPTPSEPPILFLFAAAFGLLAGVKFYALGYAGLAATTFFLLSWRQRGLQSAAKLAAAALFGFLLCGSYWYLRNICMAGSPLYPKTFDPQTDLISKIYPDIAHTSFLGNGRPELYQLAVKAIWHMTGPCQVTAFILIPITIAWNLIAAWRQRRMGEPRVCNSRYALSMLAVGACGILLITPFAVEDQPGTLNQMLGYYCPVRYGMCFLSLTVLVFALALQDICSKPWPLRCLPSIFFLGSGIYQFAFAGSRGAWEKTDAVIIAGFLILLAFNAFLLVEILPRLGRATLSLASLALLCGGAFAVEDRAERWHRDFTPFYGRMFLSRGFSSLGNEPLESRICVLAHRAYPFFGSRRQFRVCQPMYAPSPVWLLAYLQDHDVQLVATRTNRPTSGWHLFEYLGECLHDYPDRFQRLTVDDNLAVFRYEGKYK